MVLSQPEDYDLLIKAFKSKDLKDFIKAFLSVLKKKNQKITVHIYDLTN